jgi:hypothetical protein
MLDYLAAIGVGTLVFLVFMLVFIKRDSRGQRGGRLAGCQHHHEDGQGCDRCRDAAPASIRPHPPDQNND